MQKFKKYCKIWNYNWIYSVCFQNVENFDKTGDAILILFMNTLKLRTGEVLLLKFKDGENQEQPTIKVYRLNREN